jgi:hypothetical protein
VKANRGVCPRCYEYLRARGKLPTSFVWQERNANCQTMEELEAIIAEQSKPENLPEWWWEDVERQESYERRGIWFWLAQNER